MSDQEAWQLSEQCRRRLRAGLRPGPVRPVAAHHGRDRADRAGRPRPRRRMRHRGAGARRCSRAWSPNGSVTGLDLNDGMLAGGAAARACGRLAAGRRDGPAVRRRRVRCRRQPVRADVLPRPGDGAARDVAGPGARWAARGRGLWANPGDQRLPPAGRHSCGSTLRRRAAAMVEGYFALGTMPSSCGSAGRRASPMLGFSLAKAGPASPRSTSCSASRSRARRWRRSSTTPPTSGSGRLRARR